MQLKIIYFNENTIVLKAALHLASEKGNIKIIKLLLINEAIDINIEDDQGRRPIDYSENDDIIQLLSQ